MFYFRNTPSVISLLLTKAATNRFTPHFPLFPRLSVQRNRRRIFSIMAGLSLQVPNIKLADGNTIPALAFGTGTAWYKKADDNTINKELVNSLTTAIKLGYTHLDGAEVYQTERELGQAIKDSGVAREKLYVVTKVISGISDIRKAFSDSLSKLSLDYVDLYLIHSPFFAKSDEELQDAWKVMEEIRDSGKAKSIGVSNFIQTHLETILKTAKHPPVINQIEYHPYLQHGDLVEWSKSKGITTSAYGPLTVTTRAKGGPLDGYLAGLAKKYYVDESEILLRYCLDQGIVAVTTSGKEQRMSDYLRALAFTLTPKEIDEISKIGNEHHFRAFWNHKIDKNDRA